MDFTRTSVVRSELFYRKSKVSNGLLVVFTTEAVHESSYLNLIFSI